MSERLSRRERLSLIAELCPKYGVRRACDSRELARERAAEILPAAGAAEVTADYLLVRAIDQYVAGQLDLADLYRCRLLAYYMTFASGGEEWSRWGVAAAVRPGDFAPPPGEAELDDLPDPLPPGPPWRSDA